MQTPELPKEKQPDAVSGQVAGPAPSLWLYVSLVAVAVLLIGISFSHHVDWPALLQLPHGGLLHRPAVVDLPTRQAPSASIGYVHRAAKDRHVSALVRHD
jgi:hypothetical protein